MCEISGSCLLWDLRIVSAALLLDLLLASLRGRKTESAGSYWGFAHVRHLFRASADSADKGLRQSSWPRQT